MLGARILEPLHRWGVWMLHCFGVDMHPNARIWCTQNLIMYVHAVVGPCVNCFRIDQITNEKKAFMSQGFYFCCVTHNIGDLEFSNVTRPILSGSDAFFQHTIELPRPFADNSVLLTLARRTARVAFDAGQAANQAILESLVFKMGSGVVAKPAIT
jgi:hypothetical protein